MVTQAVTQPGTSERHRSLGVALALLALVCVAAIEALHGHACTGDGCVLCLAAASAHVLLFASVGVAFALPLIRMLGELGAVRANVLPRRDPRPCHAVFAHAKRVELTPVTMGVRLLI